MGVGPGQKPGLPRSRPVTYAHRRGRPTGDPGGRDGTSEEAAMAGVVRDVMTTNPVTIEVGETVHELARKIRRIRRR